MYKIKLSPYAKIFYTEWLLAPASSRYNLSIDQTLYGDLDVERLRTALKRYVVEHVLLNSHIQDVNGKYYWVKNDSVIELEYSENPVNTSELLSYVASSFDLHNGPLYRFKLLRTGNDVYRLILVFHHLVIDGSTSLDAGVFEAISNYYNDENYSTKHSVDNQINFISSLATTLSANLTQHKDSYKEFWYQQLLDIENIDLSFLKLDRALYDKNRVLLDDINQIEAIKFNYGDIEFAKLKQIKSKYSMTPYGYSQCILAMLFHKYTSQERFAISYPITIGEGLDFIYGAQINTNLIPYRFTKSTTIIDLFNQSKEFFKLTIRSDIKHSYYPVANIIQENNKHLLNVCFAQTFFRDKPFVFTGIKKIEISDKLNLDYVTRDLLLFEQNPRDAKLNYRVVYDKRSIDGYLLNSFVINYKRLFIEVLDDLLTGKNNKHISSYSLLDDKQYQKIVREFNQTEKDYPRDKTIHKLFEEQVLKTPDNIAVAYEDTKLTYQELNNKANQLANCLHYNYDVKPNDLIALYLDRSEQMLITIIGVLKAGAAYVPIDPKLPDERINYIFDNTKSKIILTNRNHQSRLQQIGQQDIIAIDDKTVQSELSLQKEDNPNVSIASNNLIYVLYTSGTTGNPKGVMLEHAACVNRMLWMISTSHFLGNEKVLFKTNYIFDVSFSDIFTTLLTGGTLIVTKNVFDIDEITLKFEKYSIDVCHFTPSQFEAISSIKGFELFEKLKVLNFSGEALYPKILEGLSKKVLCANYYGPTEAGEVTFEDTKFTEANKNIATIGWALPNVKLFILDKYLMPLPVGAIGELYLGGVCLARGYLNNSELTNAKFIANPLQTEQEKLQGINDKLYKTGDLVRWLPDGNIEYIGRNDSQIKIRGYRIELSEIENQLLKFAGIKQTIATINERNKYLIAYYVANEKLDESKLHDFLQRNLPEYMLPSAIIHLDKLPLTANGKLDKAALPEVNFSRNYVAPNNQLQISMVVIWSKILGLAEKDIGITESFFYLGGTSLSIIKMQHELSKLPELRTIRVADLFRYTTIEQLAEFAGCGCVSETANIIERKKPQNSDIDSEIAIIAISGEFSGCKNMFEYWDLIQLGKEGLKSATIEECKRFSMPEDALQNPNFLPRSGHVSDTDKFDANFWGITPNEAKNMDPQIRKFLEHCWYLLEISGYAASRNKINIGVFAGGGDSVYLTSFVRQSLIVSGIGNLNIKDALATRVSYLLGLTGPANNINTACSTSLVTIVEACKSLVGNYCDMAIAGGSALLLPEEIGYIYQEGMIFSKDGHCRTFDHKASGTVHGSGVGAVLLKRLADAKKDGDNIIAVIKGYATNNDGNRKISYTAPSVTGQKECIINAQKVAGITSDMVGYVECHGTGTRLGDPIEIQALSEAFKYNANKNDIQHHKCVIGAVKANIGHAGAAAGVAGLIKVCKMLEYKIIPKQINYDSPNVELHLSDTNFEIVTQTRQWDQTDNIPRIAGISSFGIGGTNAHAIVSEYVPDIQETVQEQLFNYILPLSAKSPSSLEAYRKSFIDYLANTTDNIQNIAYTLQLKRKHFDCRLSIVCNSVADAIDKLKISAGISRISKQKTQNIVFIFPGQGNQYANMSLNLYQHDNDYKDTVDECIKLANKHTSTQFEKILFNNETSGHDINHAKWAQLSLFIVEYSLAKLLEALNINAICYIGHSIGEYVAATLSGVFSLEDTIKLVIARGQLMQSMPKGAMLSILASATEIEQVAKNNYCEIAVINSPKNCVASGTHESINNLKAILEKNNISTILLKVSHAYHSYLMTEASRKFISQFKQIKLNKPQKRFISNVTGDFITDADAINPEYWANHMRNTVLFSSGIKTLFNNYSNLLFIEVGTGKSSISFVKQHDVGKSNIVQLLNSQKDNTEGVQDASFKEDILNKLWIGGYNIDFNGYYNYKNHGKIVGLPSYCFDSSSYWINQPMSASATMISTADSSISTFDLENIKSKVIEQDQPDKYYEIAKIFLDVLGVEKISVHDGFSLLGGDSFLVTSLIAKLQRNYKISIDDFLKLQTIASVAEFAPYVKGNLHHKLEQTKVLYAKKSTCLVRDVEDMSIKQAKYLHEIEHIKFKKQKKNISNVLLTGATGHVGCNILYQLLHETSYKIYLTVRALSNEEANKKIDHKFRYYFDTNLERYKDRVVILVSDIEQQNLGVSPMQYQELINNIDSIIHSAALVKHYGSYDEAYRTNVQSTINLLELSRLTAAKDFHYISTIAVATEGYIPNCSYFVFNEDDDASVFTSRNHIYSTTKYEGEVAVNKYRKYGIMANIYRVGSVGMHSINYRHQENIGDNYLFVQVKTILQLGMIHKELSEVELAPVDCVASAIVKLFEQVNLSSKIFHIFNPYSYSLMELFAAENIPVRMCQFNEFVDDIIKILDAHTINNKQIELFMLHQKWLQEIDVSNVTKIKLLQNKTEIILSRLGFSWPKITTEMWSDVVKRVLVEKETKWTKHQKFLKNSKK
ncbi:MAG: amino acid adenylation domain-containing protein [bacterium]